MIILKDVTQALLLNTVTGLVAPSRKGSAYAVGASGSITVAPDASVANGDWMVLVATTYSPNTFTTPTGWTVLQPQTTTGTLAPAIYGKMYASGDTSYTVTISAGSASSDLTLMWGSGADDVSKWIIGTNTARSTTTQNTATSMTTTTDHTLVLAISTERSTPDEGAIVSITGAQLWLFERQSGVDIQTVTVGVIRDVSPAGVTSDVVVTYPTPIANNGQGIQIGIPPAKTVSIDSSATFVDVNAAGTTSLSTYETKVTIGVGSTLFADEVPSNQNTPTDTASVELGVDFTAYVSGVVTAIRYYKGVGSGTGTKDGHLWTETGTLLATVTFVNETTSGWQTQQLATPITLTAGTNYVVSYYAPNGNYANTSAYFSANKYVGPLAIDYTAGGSGSGNGSYVYSATSGSFPNASFNHTNYFVDVIFQLDPQKAIVTVLPAATGTNQRELKLLSIVNTGIVTNAVSITKIQTSASYVQTPTALLAPGEMLQYDDKSGWRLLNADATIKANFAQPVASATQVISNNNRSLTSSADLSWVRSQDTLSITGSNNPRIQLGGVSGNPAVPALLTLETYTQRLGGKMHLMKQGPGGDHEAAQASLWQNSFLSWMPYQNVGTWTGSNGVNIGTATAVLPTLTNTYTAMRRSTFATAAAANSQAGIRSDAIFMMGGDPGIGGFFFSCRFGFDTIKTGGRAFIGLTPTTVITTNEPSSMINMCGFGFDSIDTAFTFMHNNATGTATKETISGQGILATNNTGYDAYIWNPVGSSVLYYRLERTDTGAKLVEGSVSGYIPTSNTLMQAVVHCGSGINTLAGDLTIGINRLYVETNR